MRPNPLSLETAKMLSEKLNVPIFLTYKHVQNYLNCIKIKKEIKEKSEGNVWRRRKSLFICR
jgi:transcription elongation factor GreA-like protein